MFSLAGAGAAIGQTSPTSLVHMEYRHTVVCLFPVITKRSQEVYDGMSGLINRHLRT